MSSKFIYLVAILAQIAVFVTADEIRGQEYNIREEGSVKKNYEEEEEGKLVPQRTFLTPLEISLICVFLILGIILMVLCIIYVCCFGFVCPSCCTSCCHRHKKNQDYSQVQLHRERKIGEIWKTNYRA